MNIYFREMPNIPFPSNDNYYKQVLYVIKESYFNDDEEKKTLYKMATITTHFTDDFKNLMNIDFIKIKTRPVLSYFPEFNSDNILTTESRHRYAEFCSLCDSFDEPCIRVHSDNTIHPPPIIQSNPSNHTIV